MSFWTGTHWELEAPAPGPARPSKRRHALEAVTEGALVAALTAVLIVGTAFAGGGKADSAVWVDELLGARSAGLPYGSHFTVGYATSARKPWAQARCYPNSTTEYDRTYTDGSVWGENFSVYPGGPMPQAFELTDPIANNWTGGGADCVVRLVKYSADYNRYTVLASTSFTVVP